MIPLRRNIHEFSSAQNQQYAGLHSGFVTTTGAVADHLAWHSAHGTGSDEHFLVWHRYFVRWLEDYLGSQGMDAESPIPYWPSDTPIPPELTAGTVNANPNVTPPTWTTMAGGTDVAPVFGYTALGQFKTTAELGRAIGTSYHGTVHNTVGGTMATFSSPLAPIFYPWHSYIDHIWAQWQRRTMAQPTVIVRGNTGSPDAANVRINLFVRGTDGNLWERYWDGAAWTWVDTGKAVSHDPVALIRGSSGSPDAVGVRINLFVRGTDGHLWERYWDGAAWTWVDTGKGIRGRVTAILRGNRWSADGGDVRINLFAEGTDGQLWERYWDGATWTWVDTGKPAVGEPLAIVRGNTGTVDPAAVRINLFVPVLHTTASGGPTPHRHFDIHLWERYWNGAAWAWVDTGLDIRNKPAAISRGHVEDVATDDLRINLWVAGNDAKLWERYWDGASWSWVDTGAEVSV